MKYLTVKEAREQNGLRLVLSAHVPGPWGEAAKAIFAARGVEYHAVAQEVFGANDELYAWTSLRNAPIAMLDGEPPVAGWLNLLMLAERIGQGPSLLPDQSTDRVLALGLSAEICAPYGFGWERRLLMLSDRFGGSNPPADAPEPLLAVCERYGYNAETAMKAASRLVNILQSLTQRLELQRTSSGSAYLVGDRLTACDLHWACFSNMVAPLAHADSPMPEAVRTSFERLDAVVLAALDPALLRHRDFIYERHIGLPLDF